MSEIENFHMEPDSKFQGFNVSRSKFQTRHPQWLMLYSETLKLCNLETFFLFHPVQIQLLRRDAG
jgi:CO dehydrogenase/acetyl-CoA synthase delta subunit